MGALALPTAEAANQRNTQKVKIDFYRVTAEAGGPPDVQNNNA